MTPCGWSVDVAVGVRDTLEQSMAAELELFPGQAAQEEHKRNGGPPRA